MGEKKDLGKEEQSQCKQVLLPEPATLAGDMASKRDSMNMGLNKDEQSRSKCRSSLSGIFYEFAPGAPMTHAAALTAKTTPSAAAPVTWS